MTSRDSRHVDLDPDGEHQMRAWVNGVLLDDPAEPAISLLDHGLVVGDGVFETVKVVSNQPFALSRHLDRLASSAAGLGLPMPDRARIHQAVGMVLAGDDLPFGRLRVTYTGGISPLGSARGDGPCTLSVVADSALAPAATTCVVTVPWVRNERSAVSGLKTTSYAENVVALSYAHAREASEAIFENTRGDLCEGTGSNIFLVVDGEMLTPPLTSGALAGVSRALVLEWCGASERDLPTSALQRAEEMFLTGTTRDIQPIERCDDRIVGAPGPVTTAAMRIWARKAAEHLDP
jgi:branched-chain amino acid aminotransferase